MRECMYTLLKENYECGPVIMNVIDCHSPVWTGSCLWGPSWRWHSPIPCCWCAWPLREFSTRTGCCGVQNRSAPGKRRKMCTESVIIRDVTMQRDIRTFLQFGYSGWALHPDSQLFGVKFVDIVYRLQILFWRKVSIFEPKKTMLHVWARQIERTF